MKKKQNDRTTVMKVSVMTMVAALTFIVIAMGSSHANWIQTNSVASPRKEAIQVAVIKPGPVKFVGSDYLNKGYNFLRGGGASPRHARAIGQFTILDKKRLKYGASKDFEPDQVDMVVSAGCNSNSETRSVQETSSVGSVESYATEESKSYAAQVEVSVSWPAASPQGFISMLRGDAAKRNSVTVGGGFALAFGNSESQQTSKSYATNGYKRSSSSFVESTLVNAFVASWRNDRGHRQFVYDPSFLEDIAALNKARGFAGEKLAIEFLGRWGTHVISEATFGMRCSSTMFMKGSDTMQGYEKFLSSANSRDLEWNAYMNAQYHNGGLSVAGKASTQGSESKKYQEATAKKGVFEKKIAYEVGSVRCDGYVKDNLCDKRFNAGTDNPAMIKYTPLEIWQIVVPHGKGWAANGISNIGVALGVLGRAWMDCSANHCQGNGYCTISPRFWDIVANGVYSRVVYKKGKGGEAFGADCVLENPFGSLFANIPFVSTSKCAKKNLALRKKALQKSTQQPGIPSKGVDGSKSSYAQTKRADNPWWSVDLGTKSYVCGVRIFARRGCPACHNALTKFAVFVTDRKPIGGFVALASEFCASYQGSPFSRSQKIGCAKAMQGQYVGIQIFKKNVVLSFAEMEAYGFVVPTAQPTKKPTSACPKNNVNLSLRKPTWQSSQGWGGIASRAVDGNRNGNYGARSCTHTHNQQNAFWAVDLRGTYRVCSVRITNRGDCCANRLKNFDIFVSNSVPSASNPLVNGAQTCAHVAGTFSGTRWFTCGKPKVGRYVSIRLRGRNYLTLCEVDVFGALVRKSGAGARCHKNNVARGRPAWQTSTGWGGIASRGVDGNSNTNYGAMSCTHTNFAAGNFWTVDLGGAKRVCAVTLTNRGDCCSERLANFKIFVTNRRPVANRFSVGHGELCAHVRGSFAGTKRFVCNKAISGRYVGVQLIPRNYLTLCEVKVSTSY